MWGSVREVSRLFWLTLTFSSTAMLFYAEPAAAALRNRITQQEEQAATTRNRVTQQEEQAAALKELRDTFVSVRHQVRNQEDELRIFDERLKNYESIIDGLRDHIQEATQASKEMMKGSSASMEAKLGALELTSKNLVNDLKQFKTFSTESATAFSQTKQKIADLERAVEMQNQNIEHLQSAIKALLDALQIKETVPAAKSATVAGSAKTYKVKSGDSLEKIAKANGTTIKALRETNLLANDKIREGQTLKLPEK